MNKDKIQEDVEEIAEEEKDNEPSEADLELLEDVEDVEEINKDVDDLLRDASLDSRASIDNSLHLYIESIGRYNLLTKEEEYTLAKRYREQNDEDARQKLILYNTRLVIHMAKKLAGNQPTPTFNIQDLIQEGNIGLMVAVSKFDPDKGFKFSTYATWWIMQSMTRFMVDQSRTIRLPSHVVEFAQKLKRIRAELVTELHRDPTLNELYDALDHKYPIEKIGQTLVWIGSKMISLDAPVGVDSDGDKSPFIDFFPDNTTVVDEINREDMKNVINNILKDLRPIEREVINIHYGLNGEERPHILEEIADIVYERGLTKTRITRERVRQIEACGLGKIKKNPAKIRALQEIM